MIATNAWRGYEWQSYEVILRLSWDFS